MAINNQPTIKPKTVTGIFTKYIAKVIPLAFDESMSYYECLCALLEYINKNVIPALDNNAEAVEELQKFYLQLQSYVNNYFDNLDVQEEINNKLDDMAQDGTLAQIIEDYATIPELTTRVQNLEDNEKTEMVVIGDSYSSRTFLASPYKLWCEIIAEKEDLNLQNFADSGSGFTVLGHDHKTNFGTAINAAYSDTSFDNNKVKYLFIYGGTNDLRAGVSSTKSDYETAIDDTFENAREKFPNAIIYYLGCTASHVFVQKQLGNIYETELWIDQYVKNSDVVKQQDIAFIDLTMFYTGMESKYYPGGINYHPNYVGHIEFANAVYNGLHSSGNAFLHMVKATPSTTTGSTANWECITSISGQNLYQLRITDKEFNIFLTTCFHMKNAGQSSGSILLPFNLTIPYSTNDDNIQCPKFERVNTVGYITSHIAENLRFEGNVLCTYNFGFAYITINKCYSVADVIYYDLYLNKTIFL